MTTMTDPARRDAPASPVDISSRTTTPMLDAAWLRQVCLEAGADDVGFVEIERPELEADRPEILSILPGARCLISLVVSMNRQAIRAPARSVANLEFHQTGDAVDAAARGIVKALARRGVAAVSPSMGFPMEMDRFPGKTWIVSHKKVAEAAGVGRMGIHRNVIHPIFGSFVLLGTVAVAAEATSYGRPLDFNPCVSCKLCVAACPVGAISADGRFDFSACYTHNYREFMGGFADWVDSIADSRSARQYRGRVSDAETASMWQSLSFGANYKSAYCLAVCPAGEEVIGPFQSDRKGFLEEVVRPLQDKEETLYVVGGSDAEKHAARRFPHKRRKRIHNGLRPHSIAQFLRGLPLAFQRQAVPGLDATYHFTFRGEDPTMATVVIRDGNVQVTAGHEGRPDVTIAADSRAWLAVLRKERSLLGSLVLGRIRIRGSLRRMRDFGKCFPS